jgi:hypothetical protein
MLLLFAALIFIYNAGSTFLRLNGAEPSAATEFLYQAAFICAADWWLQREREKQRLYCRGVLLQAGWPVFIPYYLFKSRGRKGFIPILILVSAFIVGQFVAAVIYEVLKTTKSY